MNILEDYLFYLNESSNESLNLIYEHPLGPSAKALTHNIQLQKFTLEKYRKAMQIMIQNPRMPPERMLKWKQIIEKAKKTLMKLQQELLN